MLQLAYIAKFYTKQGVLVDEERFLPHDSYEESVLDIMAYQEGLIRRLDEPLRAVIETQIEYYPNYDEEDNDEQT